MACPFLNIDLSGKHRKASPQVVDNRGQVGAKVHIGSRLALKLHVRNICGGPVERYDFPPIIEHGRAGGTALRISEVAKLCSS
jgi:hypothetical protein